MRSIFGKVLISHIAVIVVSSLTLGFIMTFLFRGHFVDNKRRELLQKGEATVILLSSVLYDGRLPPDLTMRIMSNLAGATIWLMDSGGTALAGTPPDHWDNGGFFETREEMDELFDGIPQSWVSPSKNQRESAIVVAVPIPDTLIPTALFLYAPLPSINRGIEGFLRLMSYSLLVGALLSVGLGYITSRSLTRPIADISQAARNFAKGNFNSRTKATGDDEIGGLGRTFNSMATSLARAEQNRREFLANVSHELKTPVASIQALAETLLDGLADTPEQQERYLHTIVGESNRINRLIHDLLDMAQLEAGELSIVRKQLDLQQFLLRENDKYTSLLTDKNLELTMQLPEQLPKVWADPDRLSQVLSNLLSNAIRHSPDNAVITLTAHTLPPFIAIGIRDQGDGIPPADLPYIWDRFYRVDKSRARSDGGTGLGLSITKKLVEAMGGEITVESTPGKGTLFTFTLPISSAK
ncbi:cell wall metabolism sensor histidine kinase WalK [Propionispora sp. 2/2-37]|uniref:sensor histidine kinase n=1 Tax=Propionispora sp. 2/2-37 TaxID=1677858 RepID=UPI001F228BAD|nr:HAMP domain-containing sensor histidine kinase [Propionispora sp. 2/2-37]